MSDKFNGIELSPKLEYKLDVVSGNPWYVRGLSYSERFKAFSFMSTTNCESYGLNAIFVYKISEVGSRKVIWERELNKDDVRKYDFIKYKECRDGGQYNMIKDSAEVMKLLWINEEIYKLIIENFAYLEDKFCEKEG